jgi:hypothetical protein
MEHDVKINVGNSVLSGKNFSENRAEFSEQPTDGLIPIGVPVRRVVARALAKARLREIGLSASEADACMLSCPRWRAR